MADKSYQLTGDVACQLMPWCQMFSICNTAATIVAASPQLLTFTCVACSWLLYLYFQLY